MTRARTGAAAVAGRPAGRVRCAIYTRKSSEEGLEQDFNSLDAQREVCAAYIRSQAFEGWTEVADRYDDGGLSGGVSPLGYRPDGCTLAIVEEHAAVVRHIFDRDLALGNVRLVALELREQGILVPDRTTVDGKPLGSTWFSRRLLHVMLRRVTHNGQIAHGDKVYVGNQPAIIDRATFARVQALLAENTQGERRRNRIVSRILLAGRIVDAAGEPLTPTHASKGRTRYRYYVSRSLHLKKSTTGLGVLAREIEKLVATRLAELFDDPIQLIATAWLDVPANRLELLHQRRLEFAG